MPRSRQLGRALSGARHRLLARHARTLTTAAPLRCSAGSLDDAARDEPIADRIAFIGAGKMAEAILGGLPPVNWDCTQASDYNTARAGVFKERFGIRVSLDNAAVVEGAKVVILAVKPQNVDTALSTVRDSMDPNCVLVSIVAGVPMADLQRLSGCPAVVRTMPNTPAMIGKGITVWCATDAVDDDKASKVKRILRAMGDEILVQDENLLDMATAISGSGPAYHYMMMEAMVETGVHMGFSRDVARELVVKTMRGSVEYVIATGEHPAQLRNDITSPGGTTAAALYEMEKGRFRTVMADSLWAAYRRSLEMGGHDASIGPGRTATLRK